MTPPQRPERDDPPAFSASDLPPVSLPPEVSSPVASPRAGIAVLLCFLVAVLEGFDIQALGVAAPRMAPELGLTAGEMGWLFAIGSIGILFGASLGGRIADRYGRKPAFIVAVVVFGAFTLLMSVLSVFETLLVARFVAGLGFGAALPNMMALAVEVSPPSRRAFTTAAMFCGLPTGGALCASMTQWLPADFDWRSLFEIGGVLPLLLVPAIALLMIETHRPAALAQGGRASSAALTHALFREGRARPTLLIWTILAPIMLVLYLILNWLPTLVASKGLSVTIAPLASMWFNLGGVAGALLLAPIVDRRGFRLPITLGFAALGLALVGLSLARSVDAILVLSALAGVLLMGANYSLYAVAAACYPMSVRGTGSGAAVAVGRIGSVIGPLIAGALLARGVSAETVILGLAPAAALAALATWALGRPSRSAR
ncbi:MAG: MFS transporter [Gammaproteobacteria bacterium]|nr:MFS transporter [Gammaproteobacteria bacterium]